MCVDVDLDRLAEEDGDVRPLPEDGAQRLGDLTRLEGAGRDLVEERLEEMVVAPVDERHLDLRRVSELAGRIQPAEATADDDDAVGVLWAGDHARSLGGSPSRWPASAYLSRSAPWRAACAAARRATGTRNGEHDT